MKVLLIDVEWTPAVVGADEVAGATATVFVNTSDIAEAQVIAKAVLMHQGWKVREIEAARSLTVEQLPGLEPSLRRLAELAATNQVAFDLVAWPKKERPESDPAELRQLPPAKGPTSVQ